MRAAVDLAGFRFGPSDPTTRIDASGFWRATLTPAGPGTLHLQVVDGVTRAEAWGAGAEWLLEGVDALSGALDPGYVLVDAHPAIMAAQRAVGEVRFGASRTLYHELLPAVLGQRITAGEAVGQWHRLVRALGQPAPGPDPTLLLPPAPEALAAQPLWWFHPLGIEGKRAATLREIATHANRLFEWTDAGTDVARQKLGLLRGVGPWTIALGLAAAMGDPDAVAVGDFHLKNVIVHTLTGRPRGSDEEMLELLAPYAGQRGRVVRLLLQAGASAPKFGPRQRVVSISRR